MLGNAHAGCYLPAQRATVRMRLGDGMLAGLVSATCAHLLGAHSHPPRSTPCSAASLPYRPVPGDAWCCLHQ
jgi:hypothetical protein